MNEFLIGFAAAVNLVLLTAVLILLGRGRRERDHAFREQREELGRLVNGFSDAILKRMTDISTLHNQQFRDVRDTVAANLTAIREDNHRQLDEMRRTVDEKLHATLERRLGEAFRMVGDRLEKVHQGLGEMQKLAVGVGDLKKVLTNVKSRGVLGEIQLESQITQILSPGQYERNVKTRPMSGAFVEFAVKIPAGSDSNEFIWLPIDSKFPLVAYEELLRVYDTGNRELANKALHKLASDVKGFGKTIREHYLEPPATTDYALMYLPVDGLYAEVLRFPGLFDLLQREYRVVPTGPATLAAILSSLHMGFRTMAIAKQTSEVWRLLGTVKTNFGKFGDLLEKTRKKLDEAGKSIDDATRKSRYIEGRLGQVQDQSPDVPLPPPEL